MSCIVFFKDGAGCGEFMGQNNLERLSNRNQDVSAHLRRYHLSKESLSDFRVRFDFAARWVSERGDFTTGTSHACVLETSRQSWSLLSLLERKNSMPIS